MPLSLDTPSTPQFTTLCMPPLLTTPPPTLDMLLMIWLRSPPTHTPTLSHDYSGAAFQQAENNDGTGVVDGEYSVNLPDGRIQHVKYHANDYDGYVADVTYEGEPHYAAAPVVAHAAPAYHAPAPAYHAAPALAHAVHAPVVAHAVHAPVVAHAGHGLVHGGLAHHGVATTPANDRLAQYLLYNPIFIDIYR